MQMPGYVIDCKIRPTRISTDTPDSAHYKVFCNEKELKGCIFADEPGRIAVCYRQDKTGHTIRNDDYNIKTVVHYGKIEIRRID